MIFRNAALALLLIGGCASTNSTTLTSDTPMAMAGKLPTPHIAVSSERDGATAALINVADATGQRHGWWSVWHDLKKAKKTVTLPHTFTKIAPGDYVLVVFDPGSEYYDPNNGDARQQSDGVVIESLTVNAQTSRVISLKSSDYKDWNCLSCPWLYAMVDGQWQKLEEVLKDVVGRLEQTTTRTHVPATAANNGVVTLRIAEEKREVTHLDRVVLKVGDSLVSPRGQMNLQATDERVHKLSMGQSTTVQFDVPTGADTSRMELLVTGFYEPEPAFIQEVLERFSR